MVRLISKGKKIPCQFNGLDVNDINDNMLPFLMPLKHVIIYNIEVIL